MSGRCGNKYRAVPSEKSVQAAIVTLLRSIGAAVYVLGTRRGKDSGDYSTRQTPGIPDVYALLPAPPENPVLPMHCQTEPCGLWIEVKRPGGRMSPAQIEFQGHCQMAAQPHIVGGVDEVIAFLERGGWLKARTTAVESGARARC